MKAFGLNALAISDVVGAVSLTARPPFFGAFDLAGTLAIGDVSDPDRIVGKIALRLDMANPTRNFFSGDVSKLTIGSILGVCKCVRLSKSQCH